MNVFDLQKVLKGQFLMKKNVNIYIHADNKFYFMDNTNFEQIEIGKDIITDARNRIFKRK